MGLRPSPYFAFQIVAWLDETVFGDHLDQDNVFRLDLLRMSIYSPSKPLIKNNRSRNGRIAADFLTYIDDARPTGPSEEECWQAARKYASTCNHYGVQDAPRKNRTTSITAGAWAGTVIHTNMDQVCVKVTQKRLDKTRKMVCDIWQEISDRWKEVQSEVPGGDSDGGMNHKAYPSLVPYLKGIHLTLDDRRPGRNEEECKRSR
jgi:hypothetical protein